MTQRGIHLYLSNVTVATGGFWTHHGEAIVGTFFLGVVSSIAATAIFPSLSDGMSVLVARLFSWVPTSTRANVRGKWTSTWHVQSGRFPPQVTCSDVKVKQLGRRFYARFKVGNVNFHAYGNIDSGRYVTGFWKDDTQGGYHGSFQLIIDPDSRDMTGLWIGYSMSGTIKHGAWEWHRAAGAVP